jgi:hypothetical protein
MRREGERLESGDRDMGIFKIHYYYFIFLHVNILIFIFINIGHGSRYDVYIIEKNGF